MIFQKGSSVCSSKREAVAAQAEKSRVTVARCVPCGEQLMERVSAAVLMTLSVVMMHHWHASSRRLANVQRRTVAAEYFNRRPFRHGKIVVRERDEVGQLTGRNRSFLPGFTGEPTAALRVKPQRFLAIEAVLVGIH